MSGEGRKRYSIRMNFDPLNGSNASKEKHRRIRPVLTQATKGMSEVDESQHFLDRILQSKFGASNRAVKEGWLKERME
jgi:hypothetical protein